MNCFIIALGSVIRDFLNPDVVLIGESDADSGTRLADVHCAACFNQPEIRRMNLINAELMKIALNSFVTMKITFANALCAPVPTVAGAMSMWLPRLWAGTGSAGNV